MSAASEIPATMRAAVLHGRLDLTIEERPVPTIGPRDVLLEVSHCGVCGTDLHYVLEGWGNPSETIEGHEFSARVVATGEAVERWSPGDEVVGGPSPRCGKCEYCLSLRPSLCTGRGPAGDDDHGEYHGAFAEYVLVHEDRILADPAVGVAARRRARRNRWRSRCTASRRAACAPGSASWSPAPARSARCRSRRHGPGASPTSW